MVLLDKVEGLTFCKGMPKEYYARLFAAGEFKTYPEGSYLFHEGLHCDHVYLLCEGEVGLEISLPGTGPVEFQTVGPGELLGWSPLLGLGWMTASAKALVGCQVLALDVGKLLEMAYDDPRFGMEVMRRLAVTLARRLNATRLQLLEARCTEDQVVS
jgi:CRP-like cAMP-binding protein